MREKGGDAGNEAYAPLRNERENMRSVLTPDQVQTLTQADEEDRIVITLLNLEGKSIREISALTGWSEAKVKVRAFRARKELKKILEESNGK